MRKHRIKEFSVSGNSVGAQPCAHGVWNIIQQQSGVSTTERKKITAGKRRKGNALQMLRRQRNDRFAYSVYAAQAVSCIHSSTLALLLAYSMTVYICIPYERLFAVPASRARHVAPQQAVAPVY